MAEGQRFLAMPDGTWVLPTTLVDASGATVKLAGSTPTTGALQSAAVAPGNGTALSVIGLGTVAVEVNGITSATIAWEGTEDDSNWRALNGVTAGAATFATTTTANGLYWINVTGLSQIRARISAYVSGTINVTARAVTSEKPALGMQMLGKVTAAGDTAVLLDSSGRLIGVGAAASGSAVTGNPVLIGGSDGTNAQTLKVESAASPNLRSGLYVGATQVILNNASADAASGGSVLPVGGQFTFNGSTYDRWRNNTEGTLLASAARTAATFAADQTNYNARGVMVLVNVTVASGTGGLTVRVEGKDALGNYYPLHNYTTAKITTGVLGILCYPGATSNAGTFNDVFSRVLPRTWRVAVAPGDASSYTYDVQYALVV